MKMPQIIVYTESIEFKTLFEVECKALTGFSPVVHENVEDFSAMLSLFDQLDILIIDEPRDDRDFSVILKEINLRREDISQTFFLSDTYLPLEKEKVFSKKNVEQLLNSITQLLSHSNQPQVGYISIPIDSLIHFRVVPFDLYIKISESKYLKRIPAHEEIDLSTFSSFMSNGISDLYFERKHNRDFSMLLVNNMINKVERDYTNLNDKLLATNDVFVTTQQIVGKLGFKPRVIDICESVLSQITDDVSSGKDNFSKFLLQLRTQTNLSFNYRLMELTSFIATQMLDAVEKTSPKDKVRKIIFASMFCDYTLTESGQIHIRTHDQMIKLPLNEQKLINEHALKASELVSKYQNAPYEASMIIKQHHGSLTGVGLPVKVSPGIMPLTKCLMTAQEISYQILLESSRHPIDVLSDIKLKFIDTPLEDYFIQFENLCLTNIA